MGTLIKIYETVSKKDKLVNLALIDLGSDSPDEATGAVDKVIEALEEMAAPKIDLLVVSHQDKDHWSLLPHLQKRILKDVSATTMGDMYYGGIDWGPQASKAITNWQTAFSCVFTALAKADSGYDVAGTKKLFKDLNGVVFRILITNMVCARKAGDLRKNGSSAVMVVEFGGLTVILPGDAISETLGYINNVCDLWKLKKHPNPIQPCNVLQIPHHGALRTIADNYTSSKRRKVETANDFGTNVSASYIVASAGYMSQHLHPAKEVIDMLTDGIATVSSHTYVAYEFADTEWYEYKSTRGIYTTVQTVDDPPKRTSWTFTITSTGLIEFFLEEKTKKQVAPRPVAVPKEQLQEKRGKG